MESKALFIQDTLEALFPDPKVPLYHTSPYTLLVAVLLSAQSTDVRVNQYTPSLFAKAQTPEEMVKLRIEEIEEIIRPIGLFKKKAKALWDLSQQILIYHEGTVPSTLEELEQLPGVGHKTASVVMIQAFHKSAFPVDTHIHRCAKRWGLSEGKTVSHTERDLKNLFPEHSWAKLHLQIIFFARSYCPARGHSPATCPICRSFFPSSKL